METELLLDFNKKYLGKKDLKYRIKQNQNLDEVWNNLMESRKASSIEIPLKDQEGRNFWINITDDIKQSIESISDIARNDIFSYIPVDVRNSVILDSMIDEAYNSSVIEGAFSTKKRTEELIKTNAEAKDISEQMILNNYRALRYAVDNSDKDLNEDFILNLYRILTENTLKEDDIVEKYRNDFVGVWDQLSNIYVYKAPQHEQVQNLMDDLINFMQNDKNFNPLIKACIIHFYFVYIHPFFDGNGRTSRALSYIYLIKQGYDFFAFFSISSMIKEERKKYYEAIENTEIYNSDMTYFVKYNLSMITKSMFDVIKKFSSEFGKKIIKDILDKADISLSKRQMKLINQMIVGEKNIITIEEYRSKYKISYETSRTDLNQLQDLGFFKKKKSGKKYIYQFNNISTIINFLSQF